MLVGRRAVGGLEADRLVVRVAGRLIDGGQPVSVARVAAREEAQSWLGVAAIRKRTRRHREEKHSEENTCGREQRQSRSFICIVGLPPELVGPLRALQASKLKSVEAQVPALFRHRLLAADPHLLLSKGTASSDLSPHRNLPKPDY